MRYLRLISIAALAVLMLSFVAKVNVGAADPEVQEAKDRADIEALMWRYARALDTLDAEAYAAVFTEDGEFRAGANPTKGAAALKKMVADTKSGQEARRAKGESIGPMYHVIANHVIEFPNKDEARYSAYWMTVFGAAGQGAQPRIAAVGNSVDVLVRVNGKWLIKSRNVRPTGS